MGRTERKRNWFKHNKLTLNIDKTKYMVFSSYASGHPDLGDLVFDDGICIAETKHIKYLGITIDSQMRWTKHIKNVVNKLRGLLYKFRYLSKHLNSTKFLKIFYQALVESQITYGIVGWGGTYNNHIKPLEIIQKWLLKIIHKKNRTFPSQRLFEESGVPDVRQLYASKILSNVILGRIPITTLNHGYTTRGRYTYPPPMCNKSIGQRSFAYLAPKIFNIIPDHLKNTSNIKKFKRLLKTWMNSANRQIIHRLINND